MPNSVIQPDMTPSPLTPLETGASGIEVGETGLDWTPGGTLHEKVKNGILERCRESSRVMSCRHPTWKKVDRTMTAFVPLDKEEKRIKEKDDRKPVSIVIPVAYATRATIMTYLRNTVLTDPIFRYEGMGPEDTLGALKLEMVTDQQCKNFKASLTLNTMLSDGVTYGVGVVGIEWAKKRGKKSSLRPNMTLDQFGMMQQKGFIRDSVESVLFEGNRMFNIDPYQYYPDTTVPLEMVQDGEFVGWNERTNMMRLLAEERDGSSFNVRALNKTACLKSQLHRESASGRQDRFGGSGGEQGGNTNNTVDRIHFYWSLIPRDWGLGPNEYPEKWYFCLAADSTIIRAQQLGLNHEMFPVAVYAPDSDGYESTPISQIEIVYGLQELIDFLVSSHVTNVRKSINDMLIVDPMLVRTDDLENPEPGKLIRLRESAWGRGVKDAVQQLAVSDVTSNNMNDTMMLTGIIQQITGTNDNVQGMVRNQSERVSATQSRDARMSSLSRLGGLSLMASMQTMHDLGYMLASQTQQLMTNEMYVKATGTWQDTLAREFQIMDQRLLIGPADIVVDYDVVIKDGTMQGSEYADLWMQMFQMVASNQYLATTFDIVRIFKHIARLLGVKNINDFVVGGNNMLQTQVMPDEEVARQQQAGNMVPLEEIQGAREGTMGGNSAGVLAGPTGF